MKRNEWTKPKTVAQVCEFALEGEDWGMNVRDWQHVVRNFHSRPEILKSVEEPPPIMRDFLNDGGLCDAYLAAYVEWLCDRAGVEAPEWVDDSRRVVDRPWYDTPGLWPLCFVESPGAFRRRGVFTKPENVITIRPGRPSNLYKPEIKKQKNAERQRRYRQRVKEKLAKLKELEGGD
jgi:hypothetical protein